MRQLEREPECGKPLSRQLAGLRRLRIGENRLVYRWTESSDMVEILAIGRRRDDEVYNKMERRL